MMASKQKNVKCKLRNKILVPNTFKTRRPDRRGVNVLILCQFVRQVMYLNRKSCNVKMKKCVSVLTTRVERVQVHIKVIIIFVYTSIFVSLLKFVLYLSLGKDYR